MESQKTDLIDRFLAVVQQNILEWDFIEEVKHSHSASICRIFSSKVAERGDDLAPTEINFRVQCFIEGADVMQVFNLISKSEKRQTWDRRIERMEDREVDGNETIKYYLIHN